METKVWLLLGITIASLVFAIKEKITSIKGSILLERAKLVLLVIEVSTSFEKYNIKDEDTALDDVMKILQGIHSVSSDFRKFLESR